MGAIQMQYDGLELGYELGFRNYNTPAAGSWPGVKNALAVSFWLFGPLFILEICIKLVIFRSRFFRSLWNLLDVGITLLWVAEATALDILFMNPSIFRSLRLLRVLRCVKLIKFMKKLDALYLMVSALQSSVPFLGWAIVVLFILQTLTAFVINLILQNWYFGASQFPIDERRILFGYFGTFARALLTTFEMAMANWPVPARLLVENVSEWFIVLCLFHKLFMGFAVIGVINAVFNQETFRVASTDDITMVRRKQHGVNMLRKKLKKLFSFADADNDGLVDFNEFQHVLAEEEVKLWLSSMEYDASDPHLLFRLLDADKSGYIGVDEFIKGMTHLRGQARAMDLLAMMNMQHEISQAIELLNQP